MSSVVGKVNASSSPKQSVVKAVNDRSAAALDASKVDLSLFTFRCSFPKCTNLYLSDKDLQKHMKLRHNNDNGNKETVITNDALLTEKSATRKEDAVQSTSSVATSGQVDIVAVAVPTDVATATTTVAATSNHIYDNLSKVTSLQQQQTTYANANALINSATIVYSGPQFVSVESVNADSEQHRNMRESCCY